MIPKLNIHEEMLWLCVGGETVYNTCCVLESQPSRRGRFGPTGIDKHSNTGNSV